MRPPIALPFAFAVIALVGCGREPRGAETPASPSAASTATSDPGVAPLATGEPREGGADPSATGGSSVTGASAAPALPPPAPVDGALPTTETLALTTKASCPAKTCRLEGSRLEALLGTPDHPSPAGIWEEDIAAGAAVTFARRADLDVLGVALAGNIALAGDEPKGATAELGSWHAFVAPGGGVTLRAKGGPARIVLVIVSAGDALAAKVAPAKTAPWNTRPSPVATVDLTSVPDLAWGKGAYHARIGFSAEQSPRASLGILKMSPDGVVPPHEHPQEWEHMAILQGEGDFVQGTGESERTLHATDGVLFSVPPATRHTWRSAGKKGFLGIQIYTPPGPEQRFKKLAAAP